MTTRLSRPSEQDTPDDIGTFWTMRRLDHQARCALLARPGDWEVRVLVDGEILLAERCPRGAEAFGLAELWMARMLDKGWRPVVPGRDNPSTCLPSLHPPAPTGP
jgi:hypothetical protein